MYPSQALAFLYTRNLGDVYKCISSRSNKTSLDCARCTEDSYLVRSPRDFQRARLCLAIFPETENNFPPSGGKERENKQQKKNREPGKVKRSFNISMEREGKKATGIIDTFRALLESARLTNTRTSGLAHKRRAVFADLSL